jgi:hypothetical protein
MLATGVLACSPEWTRTISFMTNQHLGAGLVDAPVAIDHQNAAGRIGFASGFCAG